VTDEPAASSDFSWSEYQALIEQVEDYAMFVLDLSGHVTTWNRGAEKIKCYTAKEIIGRHFSIFYPAEDVAAGKPQRELDTALREGRVEDEGWRIRRDGSRFWAFVTITLLRDARGTPRAFAKVTRDLTERRQAQEELRQSEERFRLLVDGVADYAIYMLDPKGIVTTWNSGAQKIKGYTGSQILGRDFSVFFTPEDRAAGRPQRELAIAATEGRFEEEAIRVRADGKHFWANVVLTPLHDAAGNLFGFAKITRDLSQQKRAEETARELERQRTARLVAEAGEARAEQERERFRTLSSQLDAVFEGVADGLTVQDRNGKLLFANSAAARQVGVGSRAELLRIDPGAIVHRYEMFDEHGASFPPQALPGRRVLAGERQAEALIKIRDLDSGREWWSMIRSSGVFDAQGQPEMAINIWHDVTRDRQREEHERYLNDATAALSKSLDYEATLSTLADLLVPGLCDWCAIHLLEGDTVRNVAVAHTDPAKKQRAQDFQAKYPPNPQAAGGVWSVLRTGKPSLHAQIDPQALAASARDEEHLRELQAAGMRSLMFAPISVQGRVLGTLSLISAEGGRRYDEQDLAVVTELGRRVGAFIENATLYRRAQEAVKTAAAAVQAAETAGRLKDEFLATVSHELRTPLNAILGWSSVLKTRSDEASIAKGVDVIFRNAKVQSKLIEDILDVSRIITGKLRLELRSVNLVNAVVEAIEVVRPSANARNISLHFERPSEPHVLVGDSERLVQVLWNLLSNAVKFSDSGGRVEVKISQEGSQLRLSVIDQGRGIEADFLPYVFERFKQADGSTTRRYGGLGLGLAIVRHIVELHGGRVSVQSEGPGRGSTFTLVLPIRATTASVSQATEPPVAGRVTPGTAPRINLEGVRVLVLDDERDARDLLELVLRQAGAVVATADSASAGLAALDRFRPHVIVSDVGMPEQDGYTFMKRVRENQAYQHVRAIALTAYTRIEDRERALSMGFSAHLGKPVDPDDLMAAVARLAAAGD